MICFFSDLTSWRKSSMKSLGFGCGASYLVEVLEASFLADGEFCANEFAAVNAINIRVMTRDFFRFTDSFLTVKLELGASAARNLPTTLQHPRFQSSGIVYPQLEKFRVSGVK